MQLSNAAVGFIMAVALAVLAVSGWVIFSREAPTPAPEAAAPAEAPPSAATAIPIETDAQRLERQRDEALMEAQRAREALAQERQAREAETARAEEAARQAETMRQGGPRAQPRQIAIPSIVGRWQGEFVARGRIPVAIAFDRSGQFIGVSHGDRGRWEQSGTDVIWRNQDGLVFRGVLIRANLMQGRIYYPNGEYIGEFGLQRVG